MGNSGDRSVLIENLIIHAYRNGDSGLSGDRELLATLVQEESGVYEIATGTSIAIGFERNDVNNANFGKLIEDPSRISFEIASYTISDATNNDYDYPDIFETVDKNDIMIKIDHGTSSDSQAGYVETFLLAANVAKTDEGEFEGLRLGDALDMLGIDFETQEVDGYTVPVSINGTTLSDTGYDNAWVIAATEGVILDNVDFEDIILVPGEPSDSSSPRNYIHFIYAKNTDSDILWDYEDDDIDNPRMNYTLDFREMRAGGGTASVRYVDVDRIVADMDIMVRKVITNDDGTSINIDETFPIFSGLEYAPTDSNDDPVAIDSASGSHHYFSSGEYPCTFWITQKDGATFKLKSSLTLKLYKGSNTPVIETHDEWNTCTYNLSTDSWEYNSNYAYFYYAFSTAAATAIEYYKDVSPYTLE